MNLPLTTKLNPFCLRALHQAQRNETLQLKAAGKKEEALGRSVALEGLQANQAKPGAGSTKTTCGALDTEKHRGVEETQEEAQRRGSQKPRQPCGSYVTCHPARGFGMEQV